MKQTVITQENTVAGPKHTALTLVRSRLRRLDKLAQQGKTIKQTTMLSAFEKAVLQ